MIGKFKVCLFLMIIGLSFKVSAQTNKEAADDSVRTPDRPDQVIQLMPAFPGGMAGYSAFITANIHYPAAALEKKVQGMAFIQFIVEKDGTLSNIKLLRDPGEGLGAEAIRIMKLSPKWSVGMDKNHPVRVQIRTPVNFVLPKATAPPAN